MNDSKHVKLFAWSNMHLKTLHRFTTLKKFLKFYY
jgi:hypothetical protein